MTRVDENTYILKDGSIVIIKEGQADFYPNLKHWKKRAKCVYKFGNSEKALRIFELIDNAIGTKIN